MFFRRGLVLASAASGITAATVVALSGDKAGFPAFVRAESAKPTRTFADPHGFQGLNCVILSLLSKRAMAL